MLRRDPSKPRAIEVMVGKAKQALMTPGIPLVGNVAAGEPILAEENIEDYVQVPATIGGEGGDYILKVRGDSMDGRRDPRRATSSSSVPRRRLRTGRSSWRCSMTRRRSSATSGSAATIRLQPENDAHEPIRSPEWSCSAR